jgi:hypothetical protein
VHVLCVVEVGEDRKEEVVDAHFISLEDATVPREVDEVVDNGRIPGDRRGAAGMDSSQYW